MKDTRCNSTTDKTRVNINLLHSFCLLDTTSDVAEALTTTVAVGQVGLSSINVTPGISQLLRSLQPNASLFLSSELHNKEKRWLLLQSEVHITAL